ncbi:MAG TPA: tannase/feruloyl esterase family alpha/beta hydrolase [Xanthobacteraceae bacterium]|jgi:feruloyl esterase|nr:tannase/feruloyl esterase family alpha/beta hydrolase [Xanthobacteraceae bacterium]
MKACLVFVLTISLSAAAQCFAAHAADGDTHCSGLIGGGTAVTNINGNVTVPEGKSCTLSFVNIKGNVRVERDAVLIVSAYTEPSEIRGDVDARNCRSVLLQGNVTVGGNLSIDSCNGTAWNGFQGPDVVIRGDFECRSNAGPCLAWLGSVGENVRIQSNKSQAASDISLVSVKGNLNCDGNSPAPTHLHGPSWVDGRSQGQCAGFSTATTSIATPVTPTPCASLAALPASGFPVPNTVITSAVDTPAANGLPQRCIVSGYVNRHISPVDQCQYVDGFQLQLPANWNGRFMFQGGGGTEGAVPTATGGISGNSTFGIVNGYAVATQNGGHFNSDLALAGCDSGYGNANEFYLDPLGTIGQAYYQSIEVTTLTAKYLINQFYGNGPDRSYWVGCSTGGRQGMVMSQNFPSFFDGIIAGDPVYDQEALGLSETYGVEQILNVYNTNPSLPPLSYVPQPAPQPPGPILYPAFPVADQALLETALLQACDALDGVADGVIDNLPACRAKFDPATATYTAGGATYRLQCIGAKDATCLSPAQIAAVKKINQGPRNSKGRVIAAPAGAVAKDHVTNIAQGYAWDGGWMTTVGIPTRKIGAPGRVPGDFSLGVGTFGYAFLSPPQPTFYTLNFNFDADLGMLNPSTPIVTYSTSADIRRFVDYGHKIIWYHGLSDPGPPVLGTIKYYEDMAQQFGGLERAQQFSRLYPVPNMGHCSGGAATDQFDLLTPLANWVENGVPPGPVLAKGVNFTPAVYQVSFVSGPATRTRPLCPYPQEARFTGNVSLVGGVPVASNPADLADPTKYQCIATRPPHPEKRGDNE